MGSLRRCRAREPLSRRPTIVGLRGLLPSEGNQTRVDAELLGLSAEKRRGELTEAGESVFKISGSC